MTTKERSEEATAKRPSSVGQWLIGLLVVMALAASLLMVFGKDFTVPATLAVITALWAAVIGAVLVTKYRRQADVAEARSRDLRLVYELQLEREIAARRQYEADVEVAIRHELAEESNVELDELKAQVLALRASLEQLLGTPLPDMRAAIGLDRPRELSSGLSGAGYTAAVADDRVAADRDFASTAPPADAGRHVPEPPQDAEEVDPVELTEIIPVVTDDPGQSRERYAHEGFADDRYASEPEPYSQDKYTSDQYAGDEDDDDYGQADPGSYGRVAFGARAYEPPPVPPASGPFPAQEPYPTPESDAAERGAGERGRRSAPDGDDGAHSAGTPASELLSQLRAAAGGGGSRGGRRRRD